MPLALPFHRLPQTSLLVTSQPSLPACVLRHPVAMNQNCPDSWPLPHDHQYADCQPSIPVIETRSINYINPSSPQPGPSRITQTYTPSPPRRRFPSQMIGAARGRPRSRPPSFERNPAAKRAATPSPPRRVEERPEPVPEEDEEEVLVLNVTPADTGFLGLILTKKPKRR